MNGAAMGVNWGVVVALWLALFMFGVAFNRLVEWAQGRGYD